MDSNTDSLIHEEIENDKDKDNIIHKIIENIRENKNFSIKCKILKDKKEEKYNYMTINIHNINYIQFIRKNDDKNLENSYISFVIKDIKLKLINYKYYFYIENYDILKYETYELKKVNIYNTIPEIKNDIHLFTIKLKAKEVFDSLNNTNFIFQDLKGNSINIKSSGNYEFENGKIYLFNGFLYNSSLKILTPTIISSIEEFKNNENNLISLEDIEKYEDFKLVNFKSEIKSYSIIDKYIMITNGDGKIYKVNVNLSLLKKISLNGMCYFFSFIKTKSNEFEMTNFSEIEYKEETFIEFIFDNFDIKNNFFNRITINQEQYNIDNKIMKIKIKDDNKKNIFIQDIIYERIQNKSCCYSYKFSLEVVRGKTNHFNSLINANGKHSYQLYFQAKYKEDLPKSISLFINNIKYEFNNPDKFGNNLIERFTIINIPEQDICNLLTLQNKNIHEKFKEKKIYDWKYLISINEKHQKDYKIFKKIKYKNKKEYFQISEKEFQIIKTIFDENIETFEDTITQDNNMKKILEPFLILQKIEDIQRILNIFQSGFKKYNFQNKRRDYEIIKYLSFIILCTKALPLKEDNSLALDYLFQNYKNILKSLINLEYIDRIKILIGFISNFFDNTELKGGKYILKIEELILFDLDNKDIHIRYPYIKKGYETLYEIIDGLKEEYPLYQGILELNSIIYKDIITNDYYHSGALMNVDDIKLELIKNMNRFLFLSFKEDNNNDFAEFKEESKTTTFYLLSIFETKQDVYDKKYFNIASSVILILLLHEICGHKKKNINNEKILTPRNHNDSNFKSFSLTKADSGDVIEYLLINNSFNIDYLMKHDDTEKLLNANLYIGNNFDELRIIYNKIIEEVENKEKNSNNEEEEELEEQGNEKEEEPEEEEEEKDEEKNNENIKIQNEIIEKNEIIDDKINSINEEIDKVLLGEPNDSNIFQKKKKIVKNITINNEPSRPKRKRLMFRQMKILYGNLTEEEKKKLKNDYNYRRYLKLLKDTKHKY